MDVRRMAVREAAECLGISADGVRQRIRRGSLESEKDEIGRVYVWLYEPHTEDDERTIQRSDIEEELRERIRHLEELLERRDQEIRRTHQLLGETLSQLRALNPPEPPQEPPEQAGEVDVPGETTETEALTSEPRRGFWRRLFGGKRGRG